MITSSLVYLPVAWFPSSSDIITNVSANASVPPVTASRRYSSNFISTISLTSSFIAFTAASTGPTPISAVSYSSPSISSFTVAVAETLSPVITLSPRSLMYSFSPVLNSEIAMDCSSISDTFFPLSPRALT